MTKKVGRRIFSVLLGVFVSGSILLSTTVMVWAAEQTNQEQSKPPAEDSPKDNGNEHSGHNMDNMKM